ncbi:MAG: cytochrome c oxidase subunit II [Pseudomonadota bacterium]|nr:cytochrome c oxidase subunit II [Pseudomonadota bacterium]
MITHFGKILIALMTSSIFAIQPYNMTQGVTPMSHQIYGLHMIIFYVCVFIGVGVGVVMLYTLYYHRKSKGAVAAQFHDNFWIEVIWTLIPFVLLVVMAIPSTLVLMRLNDARDSDVNIKVIGMQWKWRYEYLDHDISFNSNLAPSISKAMNGELTAEEKANPNYLLEVDNPLVLPIHKKVRFLMTSNDVIHGWFIPELGVNRDANPGLISESWAYIEKPGIYRGQCNQLCGSGHGFMPIVVVALSENDYDQWVKAKRNIIPASEADNIINKLAKVTVPVAEEKVQVDEKSPLELAMDKGQKIYENNCAGCHRSGGQGQGIFPRIIGSKLATGPLDAMIHQILYGKGAMPAFKSILSHQEIADVVTYVRNSWGNDDKDKYGPDAGGLVTAADVAKVDK